MKNKKVVIIMVLCFVLVVTFSILISYAYWRVEKSQTGYNEIDGACLSIELEEIDNNGFSLYNAYPMSDEEGLGAEGYHFKVVNICQKPITYQILLDSLPSSNWEQDIIDPYYIKVSLDDGLIKRYNKFSFVESNDISELDYIPSDTVIIFTGQIPGSTNNTRGEVEHTLKLWMSDDTPLSESEKGFISKVRVVAGQGLPNQEYALTPGECFDFDSETGKITGYDEENCTTDYLVVPQKINGVMVKSIDFCGDETNLSNCPNRHIKWGYLDLTNATGLETIGDWAFYNYKGTNEELVIPDSVTTIGTSAFRNYNGPKLTLGNHVETISGGAFFSYEGPNQELAIPNRVTTIGNSAFYNYGGIRLTLGNGVGTIGINAFYHYVGTNEELVISNSATTIGKFAFYSYNGTRLILGNSIESIGESAFNHYKGTNQELVIPEGVTSIGSLAFWCYGGVKLTLGNSIESIGESAFMHYKGTNQELVIPNNITIIGLYAFYEYNGPKLTLGNNVETIGSDAFYKYVGTNQELIIPDSVKTIGGNTFYNYKGIKLTLGNSIDTIWDAAFYSYIGTIYVNMSESAFANVTKGQKWNYSSAGISYLE